MRGLRLISLVLLSLAAFNVASAQIKIIPKEQLEARMNPRHSADSSWLEFDTKAIKADPMNDDDAPLTFRYHMRNVGPEPVQIKRLTTTCSCAVAVCDRKTVNPGDSAVISVTYDPAGHPGLFERRIFVYTQDGMAPAAVLKLAVTVGRGDRFSDLYKHRIGCIGLRRPDVSFKRGNKGIEKIPFVNLSGVPLRLQCDEAMLPDCLEFSVEPAVVQNEEEGMIIISFDPEKGKERDLMPIILKDLGVSPSRSTIIVKLLK